MDGRGGFGFGEPGVPPRRPPPAARARRPRPRRPGRAGLDSRRRPRPSAQWGVPRDEGGAGLHPGGKAGGKATRTVLLERLDQRANLTELCSWAETCGPVRLVDTSARGHGSVAITFYDVRHAQNALGALQHSHGADGGPRDPPRRAAGLAADDRPGPDQAAPDLPGGPLRGGSPVPDRVPNSIADHGAFSFCEDPFRMPDGGRRGGKVAVHCDAGDVAQVKERLECFGELKSLSQPAGRPAGHGADLYAEFFDSRDAQRAQAELPKSLYPDSASDTSSVHEMVIEPVEEEAGPTSPRHPSVDPQYAQARPPTVAPPMVPMPVPYGAYPMGMLPQYMLPHAMAPPLGMHHPFHALGLDGAARQHLAPGLAMQLQHLKLSRGEVGLPQHGVASPAGGYPPRAPGPGAGAAAASSRDAPPPTPAGVPGSRGADQLPGGGGKGKRSGARGKPARGRPERRKDGAARPANNAQYAFRPDEAEGKGARTTVMMKNIPNKYNQRMLLGMLDANFRGRYDFFYLPMDFKNKCNLGYAFVNFLQSRDTAKFHEEFNGRKWSEFNSRKICAITYARVQGRQDLIEHFKNSRFPSKDASCLPLVFEGPDSMDAVPIYLAK